MITDAETNPDATIDPGTLAGLVRMGMTLKQAEIFAYVFEHSRTSGFQPSIRELMVRFGFAGANGVACHIRALERKGWLVQSGGASRALRFLKGPDGEPFAGFHYKG